MGGVTDPKCLWSSNNAITSLRKKELAAKNFKCVLCVFVLMPHPRSAKGLSMIVTFPGHIREDGCKMVMVVFISHVFVLRP